jgi:ABC-type transport system substrate-binding protein
VIVVSREYVMKALNKRAIATIQASAIILVILGVVALGAGAYYYTLPPPKLTVDWWYESSGHYPQSADQAAVYKSQLEKTGLITVNLHGADWPSYRNNRNAHSMQVFVYGWYPDYVDPDDYIQPFLDSVGGGWLGTGYNNTEMDKLIAQARSISDPAQRGELYGKIQEIMVQDTPIVPVFQGSAWAVTKPGVTGVNLDITQNMYYWFITPPAGKDTLIVGTTDSIETSLDPAEVWDFFGGSEMIVNLGAPLVYIQPGSSAGPNDFVPALAMDWTPSADGLTWTFNLRQGVMFSDGTEFTADAVKYSFDRNIGLAMPAGPQVGLGYGDIIGKVEATSKYQVVFTLKHPFAPFLALMAFAGSSIVNPKYAPNTPGKSVQYTEGDARASNPNDLGPYLLTEWSRKAGKDYEMKLDANPNYFGVPDGYPKAKHIIMKFYSDATALALAIKSGDIDMAFRQLASSDIKNMQSDPTVKVWQGTGAFIQYVCFQERMPPFDNPKVRQAIAALLNRQEVVDTVFMGQASPLYSMIPNGMAFHEDAFKTLGDANLSLATSTLHEMGYSETTPQSILQAALGVMALGIILAIVGVAMLLRKKPKA